MIQAWLTTTMAEHGSSLHINTTPSSPAFRSGSSLGRDGVALQAAGARQVDAPDAGERTRSAVHGKLEIAARSLRIAVLLAAGLLSASCGEDSSSAPATPEPPAPAPTPPPPPPAPPPLVDDHGDSRETATPVNVPSVTEGNLEEAGDQDYFVFRLDSPGRLAVFTTGPTDTVGTLTPPNGQRVPDNNSGDGNNFSFLWDDAPAGEYFVAVRGNDRATGPYAFHVARPPHPDDHGDTESTATEIDVPSTTHGTINHADDVDYFRFRVTSAGKRLAVSTPNTSTFVSGALVHESSQRWRDGGVSPGFLIVVEDAPLGDYYLSVDGFRGHTGGYELRVSLDDHGDNSRWATPIGVPSSTEGELEDTRDADYFRFQLTSRGRLSVYTTGGTNTRGVLNGPNFLDRDDDDSGEGSNFSITIHDAPAGEYSLIITSPLLEVATGPYVLHVTGDSESNRPAPTVVFWEVTRPPDYSVGEGVACSGGRDGSPGPAIFLSWHRYPAVVEEYEFESRRHVGDPPYPWRQLGRIGAEDLREHYFVDPQREEVCVFLRGHEETITADLRFRALLRDGSRSAWFTIRDIEYPANPSATATVQMIEDPEAGISPGPYYWPGKH